MVKFWSRVGINFGLRRPSHSEVSLKLNPTKHKETACMCFFLCMVTDSFNKKTCNGDNENHCLKAKCLSSHLGGGGGGGIDLWNGGGSENSEFFAVE